MDRRYETKALTSQSCLLSTLLHQCTQSELFPCQLSNVFQENFQVNDTFAQGFTQVINGVFDSSLFTISGQESKERDNVQMFLKELKLIYSLSIKWCCCHDCLIYVHFPGLFDCLETFVEFGVFLTEGFHVSC